MIHLSTHPKLPKGFLSDPLGAKISTPMVIRAPDCCPRNPPLEWVSSNKSIAFCHWWLLAHAFITSKILSNQVLAGWRDWLIFTDPFVQIYIYIYTYWAHNPLFFGLKFNNLFFAGDPRINGFFQKNLLFWILQVFQGSNMFFCSLWGFNLLTVYRFHITWQP